MKPPDLRAQIIQVERAARTSESMNRRYDLATFQADMPASGIEVKARASSTGERSGKVSP